MDLVFESDGHALKRTVPIFGGQRNNEKGIIYVGEGGLGVPLREAKLKDKWYFQPPGYAKSAYHFFSLNVTSENLTLEVIAPKELKVLDNFSLAPRNRQ